MLIHIKDWGSNLAISIFFHIFALSKKNTNFMRKFLLIMALFTTSVVCAQTKGDSIKAEAFVSLDLVTKMVSKIDSVSTATNSNVSIKGLKNNKKCAPQPKLSDFEHFEDYLEAYKEWCRFRMGVNL